MRLLSYFTAALLSPPATQTVVYPNQNHAKPVASPLAIISSEPLAQGINLWISSSTTNEPPSQEDIQLLQEAFASFFNNPDKDLDLSEKLFTQVIERWQNQPADELAGLYRVRGDCYSQKQDAKRAVADYTEAIQLLQGNKEADPSELPTSLLGRARAWKSLKRGEEAVADYELALKLSSREESDETQDLIEDGVLRNPYAAWEWGTALRIKGDWAKAATIHELSADAFDQIGDRPRSVIAQIDYGIDLAASGQSDKAQVVLKDIIPKTKGVEGRDVSLLQRVIAKEGEGRMALAAILWDTGRRGDAEEFLGEACLRLDQLQADSLDRMKKNGSQASPSGLSFGIDDDIPVLDMTCSRFRNRSFLSDQLGWPESLQEKVINMETLR